MTAFGQLAVIAAALFAGAALYVSAVEHPARSRLDTAAMLAEWKPSYRRGARLPAPLALIGFALGLMAWRETGVTGWLTGACVLLASWPYTLLAIRSVNNRLLAADPAHATATERGALEKWGRLNTVRTALGCAATALFFWASLAN